MIHRIISSIVLVILFTGTLFAQGPVTWKYQVKKTTDKTYEVRLTAQVDEPWHIYSQQTPDGGPLPTKVSFTKNPLLAFQGKLQEEGEMDIYHDEVFDVDVYAYAGKVEFVQVLKVKVAGVKTNVSGSVEYMACTREQCLAPVTLRFNLALN